jgi:hypothetical protein
MKKTNEYTITNLDSLNEKINELNAKKEELEGKLEDNWVFLQHNYRLLIRNSILEKTSFLQKNAIIHAVLSIPKVQDAVSSVTEKILLFIEKLLLKYMDRFTK